MVKAKIRDQKLVIMDGSDKEVVDWITNLIYLVAPKDENLIIRYPLGFNHLDKTVMKFRSTEESFEFLRERIDEFHPGLCIFNPPMHV